MVPNVVIKKQAFPDYSNMDFTCSPNWVFPTGLAYDFGQFDHF